MLWRYKVLTSFFLFQSAQSYHRLHMDVSGMEEGKAEKLTVGKAAFHTLNLHNRLFPASLEVILLSI